MFNQHALSSMSRRAALSGLGAGGLVLAAGAPIRRASAEETGAADHPLTGAWLVSTATYAAPVIFGADGTVFVAWPICERGPEGTLTYSTPGVGTWESTGERRGYFNVVQVLSDQTGAFVGSRSMHCYPVVSEDGKSFEDDGSMIRVFVRDGSHRLITVLGEDGESAAISATRMSPGSPGFPGLKGSPAEQ
jgi:hypothetical protein